MTNKTMIAVGHTDATGKLVVESATAKALADIAIAGLDVANMRFLGLTPLAVEAGKAAFRATDGAWTDAVQNG